MQRRKECWSGGAFTGDGLLWKIIAVSGNCYTVVHRSAPLPVCEPSYSSWPCLEGFVPEYYSATPIRSSARYGHVSAYPDADETR